MPSLPEHPDVDCEVLAEVLGSTPEAPPPGTQPPPNPIRGARWLAWGDRWTARLDALLERWLPRELNPLAQLGAAANVMLLLATASGVFLLIWYSASVQAAWASLAGLGGHSLGGLIRSVHRYASDLLMLLVLAHALRMFLARKFADARWLAWVSGLALLGLVWFIGWTGYWLVWDVRAQLLAVDAIRTVDVLPIFGEPMQRLFATDATVPSLLFFVVFFLHMVLPLGIAGGLCVHLARLSRTKLLPDWRLTAWLVGAILAAALVYPATNAAVAQMAVKPARMTMDWWFLWPLEITARLSGGGIWLATGLAAAGLMTVPWWLARRRPRATFQATVNPARCFSCTLCSHDCPFGAITMVPRTDGKPFPSQAQIDPARCIGCGVCSGSCDTQAIGMAWFDALKVIRELEAQVQKAVAAGETPALAFVCAQSDGGWEMFDEAAWRARLPGYTVRPIPCSGWIEPKMIERLISKGAAAVLIVGCGSSEAFCKEGSAWLAARLDGTREPAFRPNRADPRKVALVNFDLLQPGRVAAAAQRLLALEPVREKLRGGRLGGVLAGLLLTLVAMAGVLWVSDAPFQNPAPATAEFVFSFRAAGDWVSGAAVALTDPAHDTRPVHMRTALPADRTRMPVTVRLGIDGRVQEQVYQPKGFKSDGVSVGELRVPLAPGAHRITVEVMTTINPAGRPQMWAKEIEAKPRRIQVLSYEAQHGFQFTP
jgi:ferredoxin